MKFEAHKDFILSAIPYRAKDKIPQLGGNLVIRLGKSSPFA